MKPSDRPININAMARKVEVDNRIPLRHYLRIADNLLKQATIYREEKNIVDLYVILLRFSSLVSETIPFHRDYQAFLPKEKTIYRKKLLDVVDELERLKDDVHHQVNVLNKARIRSQLDGPERFSSTPAEFILEPFHAKKHISSKADSQMHLLGKVKFQSSQISSNEPKQVYPTQFDKNFQKRAFGLPMPKEETLSRHSILGPNGLRGQWLGPSTGIKVQYPSNVNLSSNEKSDVDQAGQLGQEILKDDDLGGDKSMMESVLSLDDGRWLHPAEKACASDDTRGGPIQVNNIWQPPPPPVLAHVHQNFLPISPSKVADPRPGPVKPSENGLSTSNSYQHLHIPVKMMMEFLRLTEANTKKNLETCGVLAGSLRNRVFHITTLIIPKQESTSDSCQTLNEEEIFDVQDKRSLFPLGWIHTHPSQTCFMSSIDLHTHYSYQVMLPEAIAIVMAPTDESSPHGIFHLSDPGGMSTIRNCQQRGFHPHEEPSDGGSIYEHCSHVFMNPNLKFDIMDLRLM